MRPPFKVIIVTPFAVVFEGDCEEAYFPTEKGPLGILPGHTPFIAPLAPQGIIRLKAAGQYAYFAAQAGAVEVKPSETIALASECLAAASEEEAQELLKNPSAPLGFANEEAKRGQAALASGLMPSAKTSDPNRL
jgi:F0F1-type ATP synthase epsilon subunit